MTEIPHNRLTYGELEVEQIRETVRSGQWAAGPRVAQLEAVLAEKAGVAHAVCVASGLSALRLALMGLGVRPGDTVLVPAYSCVALANAPLACGAKPVPVDVEPSVWNLSPERVKEAIPALKPKALIAVNTFGVPAPVKALSDSGVAVVEDCAHAFGIESQGAPLGGRTDVAILSFYATKLVGAAKGGAVLTNDVDLAQFVRSWRDYANQPPDGTRLNDKMTDLEATLALCQLGRLDDLLDARRELAERYSERLGPEADRTGAFRLPDANCMRVWYRYSVEMTHVPARMIIDELARRGVHAGPPVADWRPADAPPCPVADRAYTYIVSLPLYPTLTHEEQDQVINRFLKTCRQRAVRKG